MVFNFISKWPVAHIFLIELIFYAKHRLNDKIVDNHREGIKYHKYYKIWLEESW